MQIFYTIFDRDTDRVGFAKANIAGKEIEKGDKDYLSKHTQFKSKENWLRSLLIKWLP